MNIGDKFKAWQFDINGVRDIEVIFIYNESEDPSMDIVVYKYWGKTINLWFYNLNKRFELISLIKKAEKETA